MLEDQLLLMVVFEDQRKLVKASDSPAQFYAAQQIERHRNPLSARVVQEAFLDVLRRFFAVVLLINCGCVHVVRPFPPERVIIPGIQTSCVVYLGLSG